MLSRDVARRFASIGKRRRASSVDRPYEGEYLQDDAARKGLLDAKKRAKDTSRIVFSEEQTVAQLQGMHEQSMSGIQNLAALSLACVAWVR